MKFIVREQQTIERSSNIIIGPTVHGLHVCVQLKEKNGEKTVTAGRRIRRAVPHLQHGNELIKLSPDMRNVVQKYLDWRRHNGYGKLTRRWGK